MNSSYREYPPPQLLQGWVECFWERHVQSDGGHVHRVLPDGCIDILFECEGISAATSYVVGTMTRPLVVARSSLMHVFGVRFKPGAAAAFFRAPLFHLTDARIDLCHLWSDPLTLIDQVCAASTNQDRINLVATALISRFIDERPTQGKVALALQMLSRRPECSVAELCRELSITRQGLAKGFRNNVGVSPKTLARILRMQLALKHMHRSNGRAGSLTDVALCAGYYDQPHMINEFRQLTGLAPLQLLDENSNSSRGSD